MLPTDRLEWVEGWGMAVGAAGYVIRPTTIQGIRQAFEIAQKNGVKLVVRGAGRSYGDAALRPGQPRGSTGRGVRDV
jgi:FAD/FMN-containing dehydrogenase